MNYWIIVVREYNLTIADLSFIGWNYLYMHMCGCLSNLRKGYSTLKHEPGYCKWVKSPTK